MLNIPPCRLPASIHIHTQSTSRYPSTLSCFSSDRRRLSSIIFTNFLGTSHTSTASVSLGHQQPSPLSSTSQPKAPQLQQISTITSLHNVYHNPSKLRGLPPATITQSETLSSHWPRELARPRHALYLPAADKTRADC